MSYKIRFEKAAGKLNCDPAELLRLQVVATACLADEVRRIADHLEKLVEITEKPKEEK